MNGNGRVYVVSGNGRVYVVSGNGRVCFRWRRKSKLVLATHQ